MKQKVAVALILFSVLSCRNSHSGGDGFDLDQALNSPPRLSELCSTITIIPLENTDALNNALVDQVILDVMPGYFVLFYKGENKIAIYDKGGKFIRMIKPIDRIVDIASYNNNYLDILLQNVVLEYDLDCLAPEKQFVLQDFGITVNSLARRDEGVFVFAGEAKGIAYDFEYFIERDKFIVMESPLYHADDYHNGKFFQCNDSTFFFHSTTGDIVYHSNDDFLNPIYQWNLEKSFLHKIAPYSKDNRNTHFSNVQKTTTNLYRVFYYKGDNCVLISNLCNSFEKYAIVSRTMEGLFFPIGVIRNDINYYTCPSSHLSLYIQPNYLDAEGQSKFAECMNNPCNVIISYSL